MEFPNIIEKNIHINQIPAITLTPKTNSYINPTVVDLWKLGKQDHPKVDTDLYPTIILYHGWGSTMEKQRFRGFILASLGYQVLIPCAIYHGSRDAVDHSKSENAVKYFWETIFQNIEESQQLIEYGVKKLKADPDRLGVCGNSMGGFTAAGIFTANSSLKALVVFNGSCHWQYSTELLKKAFNVTDDFPPSQEEKLNRYNPINNLNKIIDRPILILHGDSDTAVDVDAQRSFYKEVWPKYEDEEKLKYLEYAKLDHFVTTNMLEEAGLWFQRFL